MSITLAGAAVRHERRLRLLFSNTLAAGAFVPGPYAITSVDSNGVAPNVTAALAVPNTPNGVELALSSDLVQGAIYSLAMTAVPCTDTTTYTGTQQFSFGARVDVIPNTEPATQDRDALFYGRDLVWSGQDYVETTTGDLATISGLGNAREALLRGCAGDPLPWNDAYSARAYEYVDAPQGAMFTLRGGIIAQCKSDDRVRDITVNVVFDNAVNNTLDLGEARFDVVVWFIGYEQAIPLSNSLPGGNK